MSKKFKVRVTQVFYVEVNQNQFYMLEDAIDEGDMQFVNELCDISYKEELSVEKVEDEHA